MTTITIHPMALFRLTVLGTLTNTIDLPRGQRKEIIKQLAEQQYQPPNRDHPVYFSPKTIESWYYRWLKGGVEALTPKVRRDQGQSQLTDALQDAIVQAKLDNPRRSIPTIIQYLETKHVVRPGQLSHSSVYRLLRQHDLSRITTADSQTPERRSFEAACANDVWYADTLHGPTLITEDGKKKKTYLITFMDDASRLVTHSAFYDNEHAESVEYTLKQALLRRGLPKRLVMDNGAPYRSHTLRAVCARLKIQIVYCRVKNPQGKGKLEKWHSYLRRAFLHEMDWRALTGFDALNNRLWIWIEEIYHKKIHSTLKQTPLERWQADLGRMRPLGDYAAQLDNLFYHRYQRHVHKDGTVRYANTLYEVPYPLSGKKIHIVVEPYSQTIQWIESLEGEHLGKVYPLDRQKNYHRARQKPTAIAKEPQQKTAHDNLVDLTCQQYEKRYDK